MLKVRFEDEKYDDLKREKKLESIEKRGKKIYGYKLDQEEIDSIKRGYNLINYANNVINDPHQDIYYCHTEEGQGWIIGVDKPTKPKLYDDVELIENMCLSYDHSYGLKDDHEKARLRFECAEWLRALENNKKK